MDIHTAQAHKETLEHRIKLAKDYCKFREKAYMSKYKLDMILVSKLKEIRLDKPNVGVDMAYFMLLEPSFLTEDHRKEAQQYYEDWQRYEARYKGLDRLLSAVEQKTTFIQSLMKWERENG